jgi:hypothetical protein
MTYPKGYEYLNKNDSSTDKTIENTFKNKSIKINSIIKFVIYSNLVGISIFLIFAFLYEDSTPIYIKEFGLFFKMDTQKYNDIFVNQNNAKIISNISFDIYNFKIPIIFIISIGLINAINYGYFSKNRTKNRTKNTMDKNIVKITFPELKITFFKDFNNTIMTIDGLVITVIGGFLSLNNHKNLLIYQGFSILIMSIIYSFYAFSYIASSISEKDKVDANSFLSFASTSGYAFWYLIMGLFLIIAGLILNV